MYLPTLQALVIDVPVYRYMESIERIEGSEGVQYLTLEWSPPI